MCSCVGLGLGLGLGIGFREWVPIRNIGGAAGAKYIYGFAGQLYTLAGAHIPMTRGLPLSACVIDDSHSRHDGVNQQTAQFRMCRYTYSNITVTAFAKQHFDTVSTCGVDFLWALKVGRK